MALFIRLYNNYIFSNIKEKDLIMLFQYYLHSILFSYYMVVYYMMGSEALLPTRRSCFVLINIIPVPIFPSFG